MRLKSVHISSYKNLNNFSINFDSYSFIEVFVGKNGAGKSNFFEALIEIFRHIYEYDKTKSESFDYSLKFEIKGVDTTISWENGEFTINGQSRKLIGKTPVPDNVLIYYSGHNDTVAELVAKYEEAFRKRIKSADLEDSRRFIGIGQEYKELLLSVLLMQSVENKARAFIIKKLGIKTVSHEVVITLKRPFFADKKLIIDHFMPDTHYWGAKGVTRDFLDQLVSCIKGGFNHSSIYFQQEDSYKIPINIELFQSRFNKKDYTDVFRMFDNLKTLGMLGGIKFGLSLENGLDANISHFSDGQFQSVYIYSVVELFKDRNCITLLDEPDSFLHPEWQFDFLKQVFEITDAAGKKNHVLMSSHSAVTLIPHDMKKIKFFDIKGNYANCYSLDKRTAINKLSSDLIKYSEQEQMLSIINAIQIENKPVLFTEGSTDPIIIKEAWNQLFEEEMPFIPFYAFSCTYINQLITDKRIHNEMGGLPVFALFDFDKAYDQWNGLNGEIIEDDPFKGMIKKWANGESFAFMLPIPSNADIQKQVIKDATTKLTYGGDSCCEIEHLFYGEDSTAQYFHNEPCVGGSKIVFKSDGKKTDFAKQVVPNLDVKYFETFRPMFEFIKTKSLQIPQSS